MSERPFSQDGALPLVVAHRGASAIEAENTLAAFEAAIDAGADAIEFDVRRTLDGEVVVLHDGDLGRTTDTTGVLSAMRLDDVRRARIRTRGGWAGVPTFREVLDAATGRVAIDVELKNVPGEASFEPGGEGLVTAVLADLEASAFVGDVLVSSFDPIALDAVRRRVPDLATGLLTTPDVDVSAGLTFARDRGHPWVLPGVQALRRAGAGLGDEVRRSPVRLGTWLVDDPAEAVAWFRAGVDAVATNDPAPVVGAVREAFTA